MSTQRPSYSDARSPPSATDLRAWFRFLFRAAMRSNPSRQNRGRNSSFRRLGNQGAYRVHITTGESLTSFHPLFTLVGFFCTARTMYPTLTGHDLPQSLLFLTFLAPALAASVSLGRSSSPDGLHIPLSQRAPRQRSPEEFMDWARREKLRLQLKYGDPQLRKRSSGYNLCVFPVPVPASV